MQRVNFGFEQIKAEGKRHTKHYLRNLTKDFLKMYECGLSDGESKKQPMKKAEIIKQTGEPKDDMLNSVYELGYQMYLRGFELTKRK